MDALYVGVMSGTSMDGIDAVLVRFSAQGMTLLGRHYRPWPEPLGAELRRLTTPGGDEIERLGRADASAGDALADAVLGLLAETSTPPEAVTAIGCHGQTIRHRPDATPAFTLQIGDPNRIAQRTGITTIADFRRRDMAAGGEGAPLVPAFHHAILRRSEEFRVVLNIGGIANITLLPKAPESALLGFDTGPGNTLMDYWARRHLGTAFDADGAWGARGRVIQPLLMGMLGDAYLNRAPPKSTGPEYFSAAWLEGHLTAHADAEPVDVQATLLAYTAQTVADAVERHAPGCERLLVCGGGTRNGALMQRLSEVLPKIPVATTEGYGIPPEAVEASAFAWLARRTLGGEAGNLPSVTGAAEPVVLGGIYPGRNWRPQVPG